MLKEEEISDINRELAHCHKKRSGCIEALKTIQKHRGWVSDDAIKELSAYLDMTPDELDGVATFFNLIFRKPVGRHIILLCDGVVCWMTGGVDLKKYLFDKLGVTFGETTADGRFTLLPNSCLGICDRAPAFMVDDRTYTDLTVNRIDAILDEFK